VVEVGQFERVQNRRGEKSTQAKKRQESWGSNPTRLRLKRAAHQGGRRWRKVAEKGTVTVRVARPVLYYIGGGLNHLGKKQQE